MHFKTVKGNIKTIPSENIFQKKSFDSIVNTILYATNEKIFTSLKNMPITLNKLPQKQ